MTDRLTELASHTGRVAIDTEFMSEGRYQALFCLAQVAVPDPDAPDGVLTEIIDPLEGDPPGDLPGALADPSTEVIVHAGRQDVAILKRVWNTRVTNVFDTQVAAAFLGYGPQEGYENLVKRVLGLSLRGSEGYTRWDRRPLSSQQLQYAREDAANLLALAERLQAELAERGRLEWAREESRGLEGVDDERAPVAMYRRVPKVTRLDQPARALAFALVEWRERTAREGDRPASRLLPDQVVYELARRRPTSRQQLEQVRGLPPETLNRRWKGLLEVLGSDAHPEAPPVPDSRPPSDPASAPAVSLAQALVRHRAREARVSTELVATQPDLQALVSSVRRGEPEPELRVLSGWRRDLVGAELLELAHGRRSLSVGRDGGLTVIEAAGPRP